eukprot:GHVR01063393.1.p1 GENE.GHVR01063393.1~~GHVR01063393.1.p1  ORF type:complete len:132 (+),score=34.17 GHVR01063393.1:190-585(+)
MYDQQRNGMLGTQFTVDQCQFMNEQVKTTVSTVSAMKHANTQLKQEFSKIKIGEVERISDQMQDLYMEHEDINEALARSYELPGCDDDTLEQEFASLQEEIAFEDASSYLPVAMPTAPTVPIGGLEPPTAV